LAREKIQALLDRFRKAEAQPEMPGRPGGSLQQPAPSILVNLQIVLSPPRFGDTKVSGFSPNRPAGENGITQGIMNLFAVGAKTIQLPPA